VNILTVLPPSFFASVCCQVLWKQVSRFKGTPIAQYTCFCVYSDLLCMCLWCVTWVLVDSRWKLHARVYVLNNEQCGMTRALGVCVCCVADIWWGRRKGTCTSVPAHTTSSIWRPTLATLSVCNSLLYCFLYFLCVLVLDALSSVMFLSCCSHVSHFNLSAPIPYPDSLCRTLKVRSPHHHCQTTMGPPARGALHCCWVSLMAFLWCLFWANICRISPT